MWVEDDCLNFREPDYGLLTDSYFTHAIVCFFHLDPGPKLVYNGKDRDPYGVQYDQWWKYLQGLRQGPLAKTLMLSVGGWDSETWSNVQGKDEKETAAKVKEGGAANRGICPSQGFRWHRLQF